MRSLLFAGGASLGAGAAAGGAAGVGTFTAVAGLATASTGAAISTLSGAAATSATLAWLGGGALATGGAGVAGGTAVLATAVTVPIAAVAGVVLIAQGRRILAKQQAANVALNRAADNFTHNADIINAYMRRVGAIKYAIQFAVERGSSALQVISGEVNKRNTPSSFSSLNQETKSSLHTAASLITTILTLISLPIQLRLEASASLVPADGRSEDDLVSDVDTKARLLREPDYATQYIDLAISEAIGQIARS
jgi:hypothetical protein